MSLNLYFPSPGSVFASSSAFEREDAFVFLYLAWPVRRLRLRPRLRLKLSLRRSTISYGAAAAEAMAAGGFAHLEPLVNFRVGIGNNVQHIWVAPTLSDDLKCL